MYSDLGFDLLQDLKAAAAAGIKTTKAVLLARGGQAIAATPEGQQAIRQSLAQQAADRAADLFSSPIVPIALGLGAVYFLFGRRR